MTTTMYRQIYVDGAWRSPIRDDVLEVFDSVDGTSLGAAPACTAGDVETAMQAAHRAGSSWALTPASDRADLCDRIADGIAARDQELAALITRETGMPRWLSQHAQVGLPIASFREAARIARTCPQDQELGNSLIVREPVGVVGCITPWNYPLHQIAAKVAYAIAAGCTVVVKPSEVAPLDSFVLAEVIDEVGLPPGVVNIVTGTGVDVGEAVICHDLVDMVSFTGSTAAGQRIAHLAAQSITKVTLELGGKSANIFLDDLDDDAFERAVRDGVFKGLINSGQTCTALTRMIVPTARLPMAEAIVADEMERRYRPSDPFVEGARLGPLASSAQLDRVRSYINRGSDDGARLVTGGAHPPDDVPAGGYYVRPTAFTDVTNEMAIAREEIFGPVLCLLGHRGAEDAVAIANDNAYGLAAGVWSADVACAVAVGRRLVCGHVEVNGGPHNPVAPFGGRKRSGYGLEYGTHGYDEFLDVKSMQLPVPSRRSS